MARIQQYASSLPIYVPAVHHKLLSEWNFRAKMACYSIGLVLILALITIGIFPEVILEEANNR